MRYAQLLTLILLTGLAGCSGSDVSNTPTAQKPKTGEASQPLAETPNTGSSDARTLEIVTEKTATASTTPSTFNFVSPIFDAPVMLMAGDKPMNAGHSYPSPAIIDIDNDGVAEMVLGEIMGTVSFCENENRSGGDPVWSAVSPVLMADRRPLKLNNW